MRIQIDSRKIKAGDIFVCIQGVEYDGHDYIEDALKLGAKYILVEKNNFDHPKIIKIKNTKEYVKKYLNNKMKDQLKHLKIIGITGTNGKTTVTSLVYQMLQNQKINCATIGTLGYQDNQTTIAQNNTTPDIITLYSYLQKAIDHHIQVVIMEVSSHGLMQERIGLLQFDIVAYTNLSLDHLDYHHTMDNYVKAKAKIMNHLKKSGISIYNQDDHYKKYFISNNSFSFGYKESDFQIIKTNTRKNATKLIFLYDTYYHVDVPFVCSYNMMNYICALAISYMTCGNLEGLIENSYSLKLPPGRTASYTIKDALVIIDYAHSPDAIIKVIKAFVAIKKRRLICIVGCGGNRDSSKRPIIGNLVTKYCDYVYFTNDNPRHENPLEIISQMIGTIQTVNYEIILNRANAIKKALDHIKADDILLILGKGHEQYQDFGDKKLKYNDYDEIKKYTDTSM